MEPYGKEAAAFTRQQLEGKASWLEKDVSGADRYGRLLRYAWAEGQMVNAVLVAEGYAQAATFPPGARYAGLFRELQRQAREQGRGLWGACPAPGR